MTVARADRDGVLRGFLDVGTTAVGIYTDPSLLTLATVFSADSGVGTKPNPLLPDGNGRIKGYLEYGARYYWKAESGTATGEIDTDLGGVVASLGVLTPLDFGAVGDGVANDTVALQAWIDACRTLRVKGVIRGGLYKITATLDISECSGLILEGSGANPFANFAPAGGTRIVQHTNNVPILRIKADGAHGSARALRFRDFSLAYATQQTVSETGAFGIELNGGGHHDIHFADVSVEGAYDGIKYTAGVLNSQWNIYLDRIRIWNSAHGGINAMNNAGSVMQVWTNIFISNIPGGPTPTSYAVSHTKGLLSIHGLDIEGWQDFACAFSGNGSYSIENLWIEHHTFSGTAFGIIYVGNNPLRVRTANISNLVGTPDTYNGAIFLCDTGGSLDLDDINLAFSNDLSGTVSLVTGGGLDSKSHVPKGRIANYGAKTIVLKYNRNYGAVSVADGGTITHDLFATPGSVRVTPTVAGEFVSVTAVSSTTLTVAIKKHDGTAGTTQTVYWEAEV